MYLLMKPRHKYLCISNEVLPIHSNYLHCIGHCRNLLMKIRHKADIFHIVNKFVDEDLDKLIFLNILF